MHAPNKKKGWNNSMDNSKLRTAATLEEIESNSDSASEDPDNTAAERSNDAAAVPCAAHLTCSIEKALDVLGGKWTFLIIRDLFDGTRRFGELRQSLCGVSPKTLSARLRDLEKKNIVERRAYATIPPTVEYSLTEKGRSLKPIIKAMKIWGAQWG